MRALPFILIVYLIAFGGMFGFYGDFLRMFSEGTGTTGWALFGHMGAGIVIIIDQASRIAANLIAAHREEVSESARRADLSRWKN